MAVDLACYSGWIVGHSEGWRGGGGATAVTAPSERPALSVGRSTHEFTLRDPLCAGFPTRLVFCCRFALRLPCGPALRPYGLRAARPSPRWSEASKESRCQPAGRFACRMAGAPGPILEVVWLNPSQRS